MKKFLILALMCSSFSALAASSTGEGQKVTDDRCNAARNSGCSTCITQSCGGHVTDERVAGKLNSPSSSHKKSKAKSASKQ